ncbi:MAG: hypothetical protein ACLGIJ_12860 [Candidatus Limnocylindria bacterium]
MRRLAEIEADLAEETLDAVRHGTVAGLAGRRMARLIRGIPADVAWRMFDAPAMAAALRLRRDWVPLTRWTLMALAVAAVGTAGALGLIARPLLDPSARTDSWLGWGPYAFAGACIAALVAVLVAVPAPQRALVIVVLAAVVGTMAAPWFVGPWLLVVTAVGARWYESRSTRPGRR